MCVARHYRGVVRAREDRKAGRLWKARDRLTGVLAEAPADQETLELLGAVHREMGDLPNAGRYWFLTEKTGPEVDEALAALHDRYPFPELLRRIPARASREQYPPTVQVRLEELAGRAEKHGVGWKSGQVTHTPPAKTDGLTFRDVIPIALILVFGPGLWLLGIASAISLFID